jgi:hypothetical protein
MLSNPSRYFIFSILILSVSAGHGLEKFLSRSEINPKKYWTILFFCLVLCTMGLLVPRYSPSVEKVNSYFWAATAGFFILTVLYFRQGTEFYRVLLICGLIGDPILISTEILQGNYRREDLQPPMKIIKAIKQYSHQERIASIQPEDLRDTLLNPFDDWFCAKYKISRAGGYEPLVMLRTLRFLAQMDGTGDIKGLMWGFRPWEFARPDLYNIAGITHLITFKPIKNPHLTFITQDTITMPHFHGGWWREKQVYIYENMDVLPRAFFLAESSRDSVTPIAIKFISPNHRQLDFHTEQPGLVVISESFHPGWTAQEQENSLHLRPFLETFISFNIPPGEHEIRLEFAPQSYHLGLKFTLIGILLVTISFVSGLCPYQLRASAFCQDKGQRIK